MHSNLDQIVKRCLQDLSEFSRNGTINFGGECAGFCFGLGVLRVTVAEILCYLVSSRFKGRSQKSYERIRAHDL